MIGYLRYLIFRWFACRRCHGAGSVNSLVGRIPCPRCKKGK